MPEVMKTVVEKTLDGTSMELAALNARSQVSKLVKVSVDCEIAEVECNKLVAETKRDMINDSFESQRFAEEMDLIDKLGQCGDSAADRLKARRIIARLTTKFNYSADDLAVIRPVETAAAVVAEPATQG